ncbi:endonuclease/exonuclease/phosphatase family protein [Telmatospirillum sp. J64-1]|uniref:endonuclease/exonuclease/phosphatase family protein n=1 Tax=Telmatospirillum sp. J64-1 TaxID=2502183 RepID=UPI00115EC58F|nr:endonuclease/exonuclease/phosphatase family protein [Telmatospirillum sp. J64-1]
MSLTLRIATFNLENLDTEPEDGIDFDDRLRVLRPQLHRLRADLLCLQEVNAEGGKKGPRSLAALDALVEGTEYAGYHRVCMESSSGGKPADRHNLVLMSRFPIESHTQVWHDLVDRPRHCSVTSSEGEDGMDVEWDRPFLHSVVTLETGQRLHVLNLHLRAPRASFLPGQKGHGVWQSIGGWAEGYFLATIKAAGQALEVRLLLDRLFDDDPEALVVVCGDFNAEERDPPLRIICGDEEDAANGHLAGRIMVPLDRSLSESQRFSAIHLGRRQMLDHILVSRPLLGWYRHCEVHNETLGDELVSPGLIRGSPETYHAPVVAEFEPPRR